MPTADDLGPAVAADPSGHADFHRVVRERVHQHFTRNAQPRTGDWRMFAKSTLILAFFAASYAVLVFGEQTLVTGSIAAFCFAQSIVLVGLNIMHDGNHGSYSRSRRINGLMGGVYDLIGGSNFVWRFQHNQLHHNYTNIEGMDHDLETNAVLRLSPYQGWCWWHRYQHLYAFVLYGLMTLSLLVGDARQFISGRMGSHPLPARTRADYLVFIGMKAVFVGYMLVIPALVHPLTHVLVAFVAIQLTIGLSVTLVFQLAHVVGGTKFAGSDRGMRVAAAWAVHQVETTVNFATGNRMVSWYLGGLNFQIEHHLFRQVCHIHYPAISRIVRQTCAEFGVRYLAFPTVGSAVRAHYRFLRDLGQPPRFRD